MAKAKVQAPAADAPRLERTRWALELLRKEPGDIVELEGGRWLRLHETGALADVIERLFPGQTREQYNGLVRLLRTQGQRKSKGMGSGAAEHFIRMPDANEVLANAYGQASKPRRGGGSDGTALKTFERATVAVTTANSRIQELTERLAALQAELAEKDEIIAAGDAEIARLQGELGAVSPAVTLFHDGLAALEQTLTEHK